MTNDDVHGHLNEWLYGLLKVPVIKDRQQLPRPARPYAMTDLANWGDLDENVTDLLYEETDTLNSAGELEVKASTLIEREFTFLFFVYGDKGDALTNQLYSAAHILQSQDALRSLGLVLHEVSRSNSVPELIDEVWEPRSQCNITLRANVQSEGMVVDTIDKPEFSITAERV